MKPRYWLLALQSILRPRQYPGVPNLRNTPLKFVVGGGDDTTSSDEGSYLYHDHPDTPEAGDDLRSRWVPPTLVNKDDDYHSSILKKDGYL